MTTMDRNRDWMFLRKWECLLKIFIMTLFVITNISISRTWHSTFATKCRINLFRCASISCSDDRDSLIDSRTETGDWPLPMFYSSVLYSIHGNDMSDRSQISELCCILNEFLVFKSGYIYLGLIQLCKWSILLGHLWTAFLDAIASPST